MRDSFIKIREVLSFGSNTAGLNEYYSQWACDYERDIKDQNWVSHEVTCDLVKLLATSYIGDELTILDAGCGTGLVGVGLRQRGLSVIDGIDLNAEMVRIARQRNAYRNLWSGIDLNDPDSKTGPSQLYDIVASSGTFTHGHATPSALLTLSHYTRPGGFIIVSTRLSYSNATNFKGFVDNKVSEGSLELLFSLREARYIDEEGANYWVIRRLAV